ncbi:MAG TPA: 4a-hydroxytetrahydrobiopterin dehydratase [Ktedonobacteraceae bacterium]|jgi:4a-hydroxytetrahydrobiopterin dehydratase
MEQLNQARCVPCEGGIPPAADSEIAGYLAQLPGWVVIEVERVKRLSKAFAFDNFVYALAFTNRVGDLAEADGHHPALLTEWGKVTVTWWTHAIGGLHKNDFIMAAKTEEAFQRAAGTKS